MKKLIVASLLTTCFAPAPAFAVPVQPTAEMMAVCAATTVVNPDPNSTYAAVLNTGSITAVTGAEYEQSRTTITNIPGGTLINKVGPSFVAGSEGRNGGSPNIFGTFKTIATYSGGTLVQNVVYAQDTVFTFGCTVSKTNKQGNVTTPPGLQVSGLTITVSEVTRSIQDNRSAPDVTVEELSQAVICNSPLRNPGVWRAQNGYTGECSTAKFNSLGSITIHSNSLPPLNSPSAPADHQRMSPAYNSPPATVADDEPREDLSAPPVG